jgi:hypothetical protein
LIYTKGGEYGLPAYFDVTFSYEYRNLQANFVNQVYFIFFNHGFTFKQEYFEENIILEEIIEWNQSKLEQKFELGFTQNLKHDYKQICFNREGYEHLRAFWSFSNNEISLTFITPEYDVLGNDNFLDENFHFLFYKLEPIIELSKDIWKQTEVTAIQTALESDDGVTGLSELLSGKEKPLVHPFAMIKKDIYVEQHELEIQTIPKDGILLIDKSLIK